jgi:hypothetical protein
MNIILHHKRHPELVNDEHLWSGTLELQDQDGKRVRADSFVGMTYRKMLVMLSRMLRENPESKVVFRRTDRKGLQPILLGEDIRVLLRDDPVQALRYMDLQPGSPVQGDERNVTPEPVLRAGLDTLADAFGERVYLKMQHGQVQDPLTGTWSQLAYGPKIGWRIRGESNKSESWLPIQLEGVVIDTCPSGETEEELKADMQVLAAALATCRWASVEVEQLLQRSTKKFFLPRRWNNGRQWIDRADLRARLDKYKKEIQS